eukprot:scaffold86909_cov32-Prasinocladus_malaysianus.AAC.1
MNHQKQTSVHSCDDCVQCTKIGTKAGQSMARLGLGADPTEYDFQGCLAVPLITTDGTFKVAQDEK